HRSLLLAHGLLPPEQATLPVRAYEFGIHTIEVIRLHAGEALGELADALRDVAVGLVQVDRTTLVQRGRHEAARRDHRVDLDLHHAFDVAGIEPDLAVRPVQHDAEPLARQAD